MASLLRSILSIFSGKMVGVLISLVFTPLLVRILSQSQYGLYASVLAAFSIITLLSKGGLFDATRKSVAEHSHDRDELSLIVVSSLLLSIGYGVFVVSLLVLALQFGLVPNVYNPYVKVLTGAILFGNVFSIVRGSFYGLQRELVGEVLQIFRTSAYAMSALTLAYIGYDVVGVFIGYTASFLILGTMGVVLVFTYVVPPSLNRNGLFSYGKEVAVYGGFQLIGGLSAILLYKTDILLVEFFRGQTATALYQSAIVPAEMIWFVPSAIQIAFLQYTATLWADDDVDEINENMKTGLKYVVLSLTLFGTGLFALADQFLFVYFGAEYVEAGTTLKILIVGTFFFGTARVVVPVLQATGWVRQTELITAGALIINIALNVLLIPPYGIIGAGIGTGVSYFSLFVGYILLWKQSPFNLVSLRWTGRLVIVQGLFAVSFVALVSTSDFSPLISLIVFPPLGLVMFVYVNTMSGYIPMGKVKAHANTVINYII